MKLNAFDQARADYNRVCREVMRSWALLWRAEVKAFGRTEMAAMCVENARRWAKPLEATR